MSAAGLGALVLPITRDPLATWPAVNYAAPVDPDANDMTWAGALGRRRPLALVLAGPLVELHDPPLVFEHRFNGISATEFHHRFVLRLKSRRLCKSRMQDGLDGHDQAREKAAHTRLLADTTCVNVAVHEAPLAEARRTALGRLDFLTHK
ncbi:hypothetical protein H9P43_007937 [Blastocladiella emersonii ATCC 22665]|nr:hypothetical protein H9P43_007937 [Blastocladiella emersonii ATCC 22665]